MAEMSPEAYAKWERSVADLFDAMKTHEPFRTAIQESEKNVIIQAKQETLSLLLESKFGQLPEQTVLKLEALRDVEELNRLYKQALHAQTLEAVGL